MMTDNEFGVLVKIAQIPEKQRTADQSRLSDLCEATLHSSLAREVCPLLLDARHSGRFALAWRDLVRRTVGGSR